jgi:hypothetical protein
MIISELVSSLDFVCGTFFHREQYRVEKFFYRMGHRTLLSAADNALLERIVQRKSVIRPYVSGTETEEDIEVNLPCRSRAYIDL